MEKRTIYRSSFILWIVLIGLLPWWGACQKEELMHPLKCPVVPKVGPDNDIVGKWKLVEGHGKLYAPKTEDYSCGHIIYHFKDDGSLAVTGAVDGIFGLKNGDYPFIFKHARLYENIEEEYTLEVDVPVGLTRRIACGIEKNRMVLNNSFLDGDILHFVRTE